LDLQIGWLIDLLVGGLEPTHLKNITLRGTITYPTLGSSENHQLKYALSGGYVNSLEGSQIGSSSPGIGVNIKKYLK